MVHRGGWQILSYQTLSEEKIPVEKEVQLLADEGRYPRTVRENTSGLVFGLLGMPTRSWSK